MEKIFKRLLTLPLLAMVFCFMHEVNAGVLDAMEKALMPGDLNKAHEKYIDDCKLCHEFFGKSEQSNLCLDCHDHKNIATDISKGSGYHGRIPGIKSKECKTCHVEHKGRNVSIVLLDKQTFDHRLTDFELRGRHRDAACSDCHESGKKYHQAPGQCVDCHKKADPHDGRLGKECGSCHGEESWQNFRFDHSQTRFKLAGKHKGVECRNCHPQERYRGLPRNCFACHKQDDKHKGKYGEKCQDCHSVTGWGKQEFDHDKETDFPLKDLHKKVTCQQCHQNDMSPVMRAKRKDKENKKNKDTCNSCHRLQDEHKGQYGEKCESCHSEKGWKKLKFSHDKTDFQLKGKHKDVACGDCHTGKNIYRENLETSCFACHRHDDAHRGKQGKTCHECHNEKGWQDQVKFDHGLTKFPLLGAHATLACEECHSSAVFKETGSQCQSCHKKDDVHERSLGKRCEQCHYVGDWKAWEFDHDKQTEFKLDGEHEGIACSGCHNKPEGDEVDISSDCQSCHLKDDVHNGEFGRHCQRCHTTKSFRKVRM